MLWQSGSFRANQDVADRVLDSMDLEREKGITILSKNTAVRLGDEDQHRRHARPRRLRRRGRARADDGRRRAAARRRQRGAAAADPLRAAQGARAKAAGRARREQDRPARRADRGGRRRGVRALPRPRRRRVADRVPDRLRDRTRGEGRARPGDLAPNLEPLFDTLLATVPAPSYDPEHPLQALVTNLDASPYVGRLALLRILHGRLRKGPQIAWCRANGTIETARVDRALRHRGARPRPHRRGRPGRHRRAGRPARRDDRRDDRRPGRPAAAARHDVDEPSSQHHDRHQHGPARRNRGRQAHREPREASASSRSSSATSRCASSPRLAPTPGRCRAAASCSSPCSSRSCAAKASS